jgi:hypothetical protein
MTNWSTEQQVVDAFAAWLISQGWTVQFEVDWQDILAERHGHHLHAEVKGQTTSPGLDIDTAYGQLLRRMPTTDNHLDTYAIVIPDDPRSIRAATRVTPRIRQNLRIALYAVSHDGKVRNLDNDDG